jgi:uncharacterized membrane protein YjjB (DUF3815 family)
MSRRYGASWFFLFTQAFNFLIYFFLRFLQVPTVEVSGLTGKVEEQLFPKELPLQ